MPNSVNRSADDQDALLAMFIIGVKSGYQTGVAPGICAGLPILLCFAITRMDYGPTRGRSRGHFGTQVGALLCGPQTPAKRDVLRE